MPIIRDETGNVIAIVCSRPKRCAYCDRSSTKLCDYPKTEGKTCDTAMCNAHAWSPEPGKDYCRLHRRQLQGAETEAKRKAELEAKKRNTLIFIARSKYAGVCRDKDCGVHWSEGDPCWWDSKTKEVFCNDCGELMQP